MIREERSRLGKSPAAVDRATAEIGVSRHEEREFTKDEHLV
jgi:hypothetical protein